MSQLGPFADCYMSFMHWQGVSVSRSASLTRWSRPVSDWSFAELAVFDHVRQSLKLQGVEVELEHGVTDEGDPWLIFCADACDVICHFAKMGDEYVACVPFCGTGMTGVILSDLVVDFFPHLRNTAKRARRARPVGKIARGHDVVHRNSND
jgi:hypothetical protein